EHQLWELRVVGSNPVAPTIFRYLLPGGFRKHRPRGISPPRGSWRNSHRLSRLRFRRLSACILDLSDFPGQGPGAEWLLQVFRAVVQRAMMHDGVFGVAGHEQDFHAGMDVAQSLR